MQYVELAERGTKHQEMAESLCWVLADTDTNITGSGHSAYPHTEIMLLVLVSIPSAGDQ